MTRTMPQPWSSRRLVLMLERATESVSVISSAGRGFGERKRRAWTWATVRLMPHLVPISPQWRMNFCWTGVRWGVGWWSGVMDGLFRRDNSLQRLFLYKQNIQEWRLDCQARSRVKECVEILAHD